MAQTAHTAPALPVLHLKGDAPKSTDRVLTNEALAFVADLQRSFGQARMDLLAARKTAQAARDRGEELSFLAATKSVRQGDWKVAPLPKDLLKRQVEITGPVERKMIINALNAGADVFMADFEDSSSPTFENMVEGQQNLMDAVRGTITYDDPKSGKHYELGDDPAVLMVRPRGWHLDERHVLVDGERMSASLFDFGLYFFHNAKALQQKGSGPYFYLPKLEGHKEARLWNDVFTYAQKALGLPTGTIKATVLIETLPAAFEMDEILYELKDHAAGLNCGRWDYIFSAIKVNRTRDERIFPDRAHVGMTQPFMRAYTQLVIKTCHRRGAFAMGGMAAQIPIKNDPEKNDAALAKVRADKTREAQDGHDGTWVAHPGLVPVARKVFEDVLGGKDNQLDKMREDVDVSALDLSRIPEGPRTEAGLRQNIRVGVLYLEAWLRGQGCVPIDHLMEDAATAEISRTQVWQQIHHRAALDDGRTVTVGLFDTLLAEEMDKLKHEVGVERFDTGRFLEAQKLFAHLCTEVDCADFLTLPASALLAD